MAHAAKTRRFIHAPASLFAMALLAALPRPASAASFLWGVNGHPLTGYRGVSVAEQIDLVADLGMRSYRVDVNSLDQADALAALIARAKARSVAILPVLIPPVDLDTENEAAIAAKARDFATRFVTRFRDDVTVWELGNELETYAILRPCETRDDGTIYPCAWGPAGGLVPLDYEGKRVAKVIALLRGLSEATRAASPKARRALGTAGWGHIGFFDRLKAGGVAWDISVWHLYGMDFEWAMKRLVGFGKPIWITEFNHPLGSQKDGETGQAKGLDAMMARIEAFAPTYDIEAAFIYELLDETYWAPSFEASMGLARLDSGRDGGWRLGPRKAAFAAVTSAIAATDRK
jgi:hypothetical protein